MATDTQTTPLGASVLPEGVHFRVWAPDAARVEVVIERADGRRGRAHDLEPNGDGYHVGLVATAEAGTRYRYRLDGGDPLADPASRFQPDGPEGPSEVIDPSAYRWRDDGWQGLRLSGQVIYELHVGTFTKEGTWKAATRRLAELAELGVTAVELLPLAEIPGRFGWGYDGVGLFAPFHHYGRPDDFRRFVDEAHARGVGVLLDVVYNHLGPEGSQLKRFSRHYTTDRYENEFGEPLNFDGPRSGPVREFFLANVEHWIGEYHLDGLRIDATQEFHDTSEVHILRALTDRARRVAGRRSVLIIGENEPNQARLARPADRGGYGLDALWNDDFHHVGMIGLDRRREAYYGDYHGTPQEWVSMLKRGFLYQGQRNRRQGKRRGTPANDLAPEAFVNYLQNHDQVANSLHGWRMHEIAAPGAVRAATAVLLLAPGTPMLFQGQEWAASSPFLYVGDHDPEVGRKMYEGRKGKLAEFPSLALPESQALIADPNDPATFERCKLDHNEKRDGRHARAYALHRDLLRLRRDDPTFRLQGAGGVDGAVLGTGAFVARFFGPNGVDRLLLVNLGHDLLYTPVAEPLLAPPSDREWALIWSSEDVAYGGSGTPEPVTADGWWLPGHAALVLAPAIDHEGDDDDDG